MRTVGVAGGLFLLLGCTGTATLGEEVMEPGESENIARSQELMKRSMEQRDGSGPSRRGLHPKHHGCVKASFEVLPGLPPEVAQGLFAEPASRPAWVRFSNGDKSVQPDAVPDIRGMAIKVTHVNGDKLLAEERTERTQDFTLITTPVLFVGTVANFRKLTEAIDAGNPLAYFLNPLDPHPRDLANALVARRTHGNLLRLRYWSTTPYLLGSTPAVKYSAQPCDPTADAPPGVGTDFLREAMKTSLDSSEACFNFMVQVQRDAFAQPIEDASAPWGELDAPFVTVAKVRIPTQNFDSEAQQTFCENLSFTPWHSLPEHRPLGGINRARKTIYAELARYRLQKNGVTPREPDGSEAF